MAVNPFPWADQCEISREERTYGQLLAAKFHPDGVGCNVRVAPTGRNTKKSASEYKQCNFTIFLINFSLITRLYFIVLGKNICQQL